MRHGRGTGRRLIMGGLCGIAVLGTAMLASADGPARKNFEIPKELTAELRVKVAYNDTHAFFRFEWPAPFANVYHDFLYREGGVWKTTKGSSPGIHPQRLYEDRVSFLLDDGGVRHFDSSGGYVTVHEEMRFLSNQAPAEEVEKHPHLGGTLKSRDVRKYIPESRLVPADWRTVRSPEELAQLKKAGVFLDFWMWRSHRGGPLGYVDDNWVMDYRSFDAGKSAFVDNWDAEKKQPKFMFDPAKTGIAALPWDAVKNHRLTANDRYYLAQDFAQPFDPAHEWKDGDAIPRRMLRVPDGSRGDIVGHGVWTNGRWTVDMKRLLDTGSPDDKVLRDLRRYSIAFAVHKDSTGSRWHHVSFPYSLGMGTDAELVARRFTGEEPIWDEIPWTTVPLFYPGQVTWQFLTGSSHAGARGVLEGQACASCHTAELMGHYAVEHELKDEIRGRWLMTLMAAGVLLTGLTVAGIVVGGRRE